MDILTCVMQGIAYTVEGSREYWAACPDAAIDFSTVKSMEIAVYLGRGPHRGQSFINWTEH